MANASCLGRSPFQSGTGDWPNTPSRMRLPAIEGSELIGTLAPDILVTYVCSSWAASFSWSSASEAITIVQVGFPSWTSVILADRSVPGPSDQINSERKNANLGI